MEFISLSQPSLFLERTGDGHEESMFLGWVDQGVGIWELSAVICLGVCLQCVLVWMCVQGSVRIIGYVRVFNCNLPVNSGRDGLLR